MRATMILLAAWLLALGQGCTTERCGDLSAAPLEGTYTLVHDAADGDSTKIQSASLDVRTDTVTVEYARPDGSHYRAIYRVSSKRTR